MPKMLTFAGEPEITGSSAGRDKQVQFLTTMPEPGPSFRSNGLGSSNRLMTRSDEDSPADDEQEPFSDGSVLNRLLSQWAEVAVSHAVVREIDDPQGLIATVAGIEGAWGFGATPEEALAELRPVLIDWARLKLEDGDEDIPSMEGVHLVIDR